MITIRGAMAGTALALAAAWGLAVHALAGVVQNPDGSVAVTIEERVVTIPAPLAAGIVDALDEHAGDPGRLRTAISALVAGSTGAADGEWLAGAIAAFAVRRSGGDSTVVGAIVQGVSEGRPALPVQRVLAMLPPVVDDGPDARPPSTVRSPTLKGLAPTLTRSTAENPHQLSPS